MSFKRYVEIRRVALVNYGKGYGRFVVIIDVINQNRALIVTSQGVPKKKILIEAMDLKEVKEKWENNSWGRKLIVEKRRAALNDFEKFKLMLVNSKRVEIVRQELSKLKK